MKTEQTSINRMADLLAGIGVMLISNGANSTRTTRNLKRIAGAFGYEIEQFFSHSAVVLTVTDPENEDKRTLVKSISHYGVNYSVVSEISILSWEIAQHKMDFDKIEEELQDISHLNSYPEWFKFVFIGIATASLSMIFGGVWVDFIIAFLAGFLGIIARKILLSRKYNVNISWFFGAFVSTSIVNFFRIAGFIYFSF